MRVSPERRGHLGVGIATEVPYEGTLAVKRREQSLQRPWTAPVQREVRGASDSKSTFPD